MSIANLATVCFAVQLFMAVALAVGEATGRLRLPYSKFGTGVGVNSRAGLTLYMLRRYSSTSRSGLRVERRKHRITWSYSQHSCFISFGGSWKFFLSTVTRARPRCARL